MLPERRLALPRLARTALAQLQRALVGSGGGDDRRRVLPARRRRDRLALGAARERRRHGRLRRAAAPLGARPRGRWSLLVADETGLPALLAILETLPAGHRAIALAEVADERERQQVECAATVEWHWCCAARASRAPPGAAARRGARAGAAEGPGPGVGRRRVARDPRRAPPPRRAVPAGGRLDAPAGLLEAPHDTRRRRVVGRTDRSPGAAAQRRPERCGDRARERPPAVRGGRAGARRAIVDEAIAPGDGARSRCGWVRWRSVRGALVRLPARRAGGARASARPPRAADAGRARCWTRAAAPRRGA